MEWIWLTVLWKVHRHIYWIGDGKSGWVQYHWSSKVVGPVPPTYNGSDAHGLIWPQHFHPVLLWIIGKLQTGLYMCFLELSCWHCRISVVCVVCYQLFSWWLWSQLEIIDKILPCSSELIPHRSHDHWNSTRWDLAWSPSPRWDWQLFCVSSICK